MREMKGNWLDLFSGFKLALDPRKMFFALLGIVLTLCLIVLPTCLIVYGSHPAQVTTPHSLAPHELYTSFVGSLDVIYNGCPAHEECIKAFGEKIPWYYVGAISTKWFYFPYTLYAILSFLLIWSIAGGAIARIAAYEIAKNGERIENKKALHFVKTKFSAFFWTPLICVVGFLFFYICNMAGGFFGWLLNFGYIGAPLTALLLPLALLSGFIMILILIGALTGFPLFFPAVAAEGTDSFDAVSRGFAYVFARPWQYLWYQLVTCGYGYVCIMFVLVFAVALCTLGLQAGIEGFGDDFKRVDNVCWSSVLGHDHLVKHYDWTLRGVVNGPHLYGRTMHLTSRVIGSERMFPAVSFSDLRPDHKVAAVIMLTWILITLGLAVGYVISFAISSQTLIYFVLRKKVDGIEMNEIYEEEEEEQGETLQSSAGKREETTTVEKSSPSQPQGGAQ